MDVLIGILSGGFGGFIAGYLLSSHIHTIANAAAQKVVSTIAASIGVPAPVAPTTPAAPIAPISSK